MLFKTILIFLGAMVLVAMIGRALFPGAVGRIAQRRRKARTCPRCGRPVIGRPVIGRPDCDCGRKA